MQRFRGDGEEGSIEKGIVYHEHTLTNGLYPLDHEWDDKTLSEPFLRSKVIQSMCKSYPFCQRRPIPPKMQKPLPETSDVFLEESLKASPKVYKTSQVTHAEDIDRMIESKGEEARYKFEKESKVDLKDYKPPQKVPEELLMPLVDGNDVRMLCPDFPFKCPKMPPMKLKPLPVQTD